MWFEYLNNRDIVEGSLMPTKEYASPFSSYYSRADCLCVLIIIEDL